LVLELPRLISKRKLKRKKIVLTHIINYSVRILIILVGLFFISGYLKPPAGNTSMLYVIGTICILFGIIRIVSYYYGVKRLNRHKEYNNEED
jgi:uncharacterized membrane protein HdeD (DUF308 family)